MVSGIADDGAFRVLLVEDNPTFRTQITGAMARVGESGAVAGEVRISVASTGAEALALVTQGQGGFQLALVDIGLPDISGIEVIRHIRTFMPDTPILVISVINSEQTLLEAIRAGARGYLLKDEAEESIAHAIADVMRGNYPISPALARSLFRLAGAPENAAASPDAASVSGGQEGVSQSGFHLAPREREVLQHIAQGLSYQEVAEEMGVSLSTIQTYVRGLYRKLEVHNRVAAVNRAREAGML